MKIIGNMVDTSARYWRRQVMLIKLARFVIDNPDKKALICCDSEESAKSMMDDVKKLLGYKPKNVDTKCV